MKSSKGIATVEYIVITLMLVLALLMPITGGKNSIELLMDALKSLYAGWIYIMSTPINS